MLLVRFHAETTPQSQDFILRSAGKTHKRLPGGIIKLTLRDNFDFNETLDNLRKLDAAIEWVEPNYIVKRAGVARTVSSRRHASQKSRVARTSVSTVVALIDTGVDPNHRALKHALSPNDGWNFITGDDDFTDDNGHGTQIAGIIAQSAISNLQSSISILPLKALDNSGAGTIADIVEAMDYAVTHHAAVINCSFGAPAYSRAMLDAIRRAETAGILVVAAAGNNGNNLSQSSFYPASYRLPNLISVAATDNHNALAQFSNFAADIAAPGVGIRTAHRGNRRVSLTGTSASAGFVAGAAALLKSKRGWVSAQTIREALLKSADRSIDLAGKVTSGVVNLKAAISLFTRDNSAPVKAPAAARRMTPAIKAAMQAGANLDTLRSSQPQTPAYQQTGTLPAASYVDPAPAGVANYNVYLTDLTRSQNAAGVAGGKPLQQVDPTAGSASVGGLSQNLESKVYNFTTPILSLPGRAGLGISLAASCNNKLWTSTTGGQVFNLDRGFPAPGWHIGFGAIQTRVSGGPTYSNSVTGKNSLIYIAPDGTRRDLAYNPTSGFYESYDSSYIRFDLTNRILQMPDGTRVYFQIDALANNNNQFLPNYIIDRNGNYINIYYKTLSNNAVVMDYIIDTAGRRIDFNYQNNRLTSISQNRGGAVFTYAWIDYQPVTIQTGYPNTDPAGINGAQVYFPSRITYPTGASFRFGYTSYGEIDTIEKWAPAIAGQGAERKIASTAFSIAGRNEWAENGPGGTYLFNYDTPTVGHEITDPSARRFWVRQVGMTITTRVIPAGSDNPTKTDEATYISDSGTSYLSNPRLSQIKVNGSPRVNYTYIQQDGMWLVQNKDELGEQAALYRRTTTIYTSYPSQYILGLPQQVSVYNAGNTLLSRAANNYDETGSYTDSNGQNAPYWIDESGAGVIQHNTAYGAGFTQRGNMTSVVQSSVVNGSVTATRTIKRLSYDTNGNLRAEADGAANRRQILYTDNYSNKPGGVGQTHVQVYTAADPTGFRGGSQWNYYTGQTIKTFNLTPGSSTEQQVVTTSYDFADRPLQTTRPDGGWVKTAYWDNWLATVSSQFLEAGKTRYQFEQMNGLGVAFKKASDHPDGVAGKYSGHITVFNSIGEVRDSSNVIAIDGAWTPTAEDASTGFLFTNLTRDELSRLKIATLPDNNTRQYDYTGCGCAGNSETRATDEMGHSTETKTDFLKRLSEARMLNPLGNLYSKAEYIYDELDRLIEIRHSNGSGAKVQTRSFSFDGYGRLQSENTPEGGVVNYTYKPNDLVWTVTNQRNVTVTNSYNTRNLLEQVSYSDGTPAATFGYDAFGARNSMSDGEGSASYAYNAYRQLESETRSFSGLAGRTFTLNYTYNLADQLKSVNYVMAQGGGLMADGERGAQVTAQPRPRADGERGALATAPPKPRAGGRRARASLANHSIYGTVRRAGTNQPMSLVTVTATRQDDPPLSPPPVQTNSSGQYSFEGLEATTYKVQASKTGFTFTPAEATVELNQNTQVDFTGDQPTPPTGTLTATPNPVQVCDGSGQGVVQLNWTSGAGVSAVEIRKGAPNGPLVTSGGASGSFTTTKSVTNGTVFYLQNVTYGLPLTSANTMATVTANVTSSGCPPPQTSFNKTVNYAYNSVGALSGVGTNLIGTDSTNTTNVLNTLTYRGFGALKSLNYGNGRRLQMGYSSNRQQPFSMKVDRASNPSDKIIDYTYTYYDANGKNNNRIRKITDAVDASYTTDYTYSDYDRLINATAPAYTRSYGSDEWGNITTFSGLTLNYATNASGAPATNRISTAVAGSTTYTHSYDAAGNMTGDGLQTFTYDGANRLKEVGTGGQNTYGYDGNGARVRVVSSGGLPTFYVRSSVLGQVAFEVNQNLVLRAYVCHNGKYLAQQSRDGQFYWVHTNHLGNGMKLTDSTGAVKSRAEFDPYGQPLLEWSSSGDTYLNTKKYTGYERDEATGLDYANARMYTSGRGRFMQADLSWVKAADFRRPGSLNRYAYVLNDPVNFVDPGGAIPIPIIGPCAITFCVKITTNEPGPDALPHRPNDTTPQPLPVLPPHGGTANNALIQNMWIKRAGEAAQKIRNKIFNTENSCSKFFGPNASKALDAFLDILTAGPDFNDGQSFNTGIRQIYDNPTQFELDSNGAKIYRLPGEARIITNGPFTPLGKFGFGGYGPGTMGTQIVALLHEIAHNIVVPLGNNTHKYLIPNDGGNADLSMKNTETILKECKDQVWEAQK